MKIGLLTYHAVCNFGANLQTLSTVSYFRNKNIPIKVIDWYPQNLANYYKKNVSTQQQQIHADFVKQYLPITKHCETSKDVQKVIAEEQFDTIIIGSDAVFSFIPILKRFHPSRKSIIGFHKISDDHKLCCPFWADFANENNNLKIISMSASAQYLDIDKCLFWEKRKIKNALQKFSLITVRDQWTQKIISQFTATPTITPDPVFGFNENSQIPNNKETIKKKFSLPSKYVVFSFCSAFNSNKWYDDLYQTFKDNDYTIINLAMPEGAINIKSDLTIDTPLSPIDWYDIIRYSNGYIGQRMHPMIVALYNNVPFVIFDHYAFKKGKQQFESSKIFDLLQRADLLDNYTTISSAHNISTKEVFEKLINFSTSKASSFTRGYTKAYFQMMQNIEQL